MTKHTLTPYCFATLNQMSNGDLGSAYDEGVAKLLKDILERGRDGHSRKIVLQVIIKTKPDGAKLRFAAIPSVTVTLPRVKPVKTHGYIELVAGSPEAFFKAASAANPDQLTFEDL